MGPSLYLLRNTQYYVYNSAYATNDVYIVMAVTGQFVFVALSSWY